MYNKVEEAFLGELAEGIIFAGGTARFSPERARRLSERVLQRLREIGSDAYPSLLDQDDLRFIYQWDEEPPLLTVMLWDDVMWRDMARIVVPPELIP